MVCEGRCRLIAWFDVIQHEEIAGVVAVNSLSSRLFESFD